MKVLLTGSNGMLARAFRLKKPRRWELSAVDIEDLDITDPLAVKEGVKKFQPRLIINCAAFTQVDLCEEKKEQAFSVNASGPGYLAEAAHQTGARLVHFSTDYIFDGASKTPYFEEDAAHPLSVYGASKWEGEKNVRKQLQNHLIIRTQWLYGRGGNHFVKTILGLARTQNTLKVVNDQFGSPTWVEDLAEGTLVLIEKDALGTYHLVNGGECTWYAFACQIIQEAGLDVKIVPCTTAEFPRPAKRPAYSVLSTQKVNQVLDKPLEDWPLALKRFMLTKNVH